MPVETAADRAAFVSPDEFGATAAWHAGGSFTSFAVIFDAAYDLLSNEFLEEGAEGAVPQILCRSADIPADGAHDDMVVVSRLDDAGASVAIGTFKVVEFRPDGTGMTSVRLMEL